MQISNMLLNRGSRGVGLAAMAGISGSAPPRISISANKFTLIDGAGNEKPHTVTMINPQTGQPQEFISPHIDCTIVGVNKAVSKVYYDTAYDPNGDETPPACWSDNGVGPSSQAVKPQARTCVECPHNVWGSSVSAMTGKQTKACNDAKKVGVILPGSNIVYQLRIPPASLKNLKQYAQTIDGQTLGTPPNTRRADLTDVITRVSFESQGVLKFEAVDLVTDAMITIMDELSPEKLATVLGTNDQPHTGPIAGKPQMQLAPPQQFATPPVQLPQQLAQPAQQQVPAQFAQPVHPMHGQAPAQFPQQAGQFVQPTQFVPPAPAAPISPPVVLGQAPAVNPQPPAGAPTPAKRGRRTKAEMAIANNSLPPPQQVAQPVPATGGWVPPQQPAQQAPQAPAAAPAFLQAPPQGQPPQQAPAAFGVVPNAPPPDPALAGAISAALNFGK